MTEHADVERSLRQTSDTLLAALDLLSELELRKRTLRPGDPEMEELSARIEDIAEQVLGAAAAQRGLTEEGRSLVQAGDPDAPTLPIDAVPREIRVILEEWREAERAAATAPQGSATGRAYRERANELRLEYQRAFERAKDHH
jgi:hypothetical protein